MTKKSIILNTICCYLLINATSSTYGQNYYQLEENKYAIGVSLSPDFNYRSLYAKSQYKSMKNFINSVEIPKMGYTAGLKLSTNKRDNFSFEIGLLYSNKGFQTQNQKLIPIAPDPSSPDYIQSKFRMYYLDVPLIVNRYIKPNDKNGFYATLNLSPNFFLVEQQISTMQFKDNRIVVEKTTRKSDQTINLSLGVGLGIGYEHELSEKSYFKIQPTFRHSITSFKDFNSPIKWLLYSAGVDFSFYHKI